MRRGRQIFALFLLVVSAVNLVVFIHKFKNYNVRDTALESEVGPVKGYLLPSDDVLDAMSNDELTIAYWRYVNTLQILCYQPMRLGSLHDGGKEVCLDDAYRPRNSSCLVYSFGSAFLFDFEEAVIRDFNCEIHTFDPSLPLTNEVKIPLGVTFHSVGLYGETKANRLNWAMDTFPSIRNSLGHENRIIDIVKMDIEGSEWESIEHMIKSGHIYTVKQICLEWHLGKGIKDFREGASKEWTNYLKTLRRLYEAGFRMFMRERGLHHTLPFKDPYPKYTSLIEISYLNTRFYGTERH